MGRGTTGIPKISGCDDLKRELEVYRKPAEEPIWDAKSRQRMLERTAKRGRRKELARG
jgi:hypothetical protein